MADPTNETKNVPLPPADGSSPTADLRFCALASINTALFCARQLGADAAVWDLRAARKRLEKTDG